MNIVQFYSIAAFVITFEQLIRESAAATCPQNIQFSGRVRYRRRGTRAVFKCPKKSVRHGPRHLDCVNGKWDGEPPACIKPGCVPIDESQVEWLFVNDVFGDGSLVQFSCTGNHLLQGVKEVTCDGQDWSSPDLPTCISLAEMKECDFEADLCAWTQDGTDQADWTRHTGATQTGQTGPKYDHTYKDRQPGYYLYFESSSPTETGHRARLISPKYMKSLTPSCFEFWFHILGPDDQGHVGQLDVYVVGENEELSDVQPKFEKEGNHGDVWHRGDIFIDTMSTDFQIVIQATKKLSYLSDIAIDDLRLYNCSELTTTTPTTTTTYTTSTTTVSPTPTTNGPSETTVTTSSTSLKPSTGGAQEVTSSTSTKGQSTSQSTYKTTQSKTSTQVISAKTTQPPTTIKPTQKSSVASTTKPEIATKAVSTTTRKTTRLTTTTPRLTTTEQPTTTLKTTEATTATRKPPPTTTKTTQAPSTKAPTTKTKLLTTTAPPLTTSSTETTRKITTPVPTTQSTKSTTRSTLKPSTSTQKLSTSRSTPGTIKPTSLSSVMTTRAIVVSSATKTTISTSKALMSDTTTRQTFPQSNTTTQTLTSVRGNSSQNKTDKPSVSVSEQRTTHPDDDTLKPLMIGLGVGIVAGLIIIGVIAWVCFRRRSFYTRGYEDELKPITKSASTGSLNNGQYYQDDYNDAEELESSN